MLTLYFTHNYNGKLFCDHFNELTLYSHEYVPGAKMEVMLNSISLGIVKIEAAKKLHFSRLSDVVAYLNIGKPVQQQAELLNRLYGQGRTLPADTLLSHLVCGYTERNMEIQTELIKEWWSSKLINSYI